jgi:hypothetical protein
LCLNYPNPVPDLVDCQLDVRIRSLASFFAIVGDSSRREKNNDEKYSFLLSFPLLVLPHDDGATVHCHMVAEFRWWQQTRTDLFRSLEVDVRATRIFNQLGMSLVGLSFWQSLAQTLSTY